MALGQFGKICFNRSEILSAFRQILRKIVETKQTMGEVMKDAAFSLAEAKFACGDFNQPVLQNVNKAQLKVQNLTFLKSE